MTCVNAMPMHGRAKELAKFIEVQHRGACNFPRALLEWIDPHVVEMEALLHQLSWECRRHVGDVSATCQFVANFGSTCVSCPTQDSKKVQPTPNFVSATPILDTVIVRIYVIKYQKF
jgi:hypothetical protein